MKQKIPPCHKCGRRGVMQTAEGPKCQIHYDEYCKKIEAEAINRVRKEKEKA